MDSKISLDMSLSIQNKSCDEFCFMETFNPVELKRILS